MKMSWLTNGITNCWALLSGAVYELTQNPYFMILLVSALVVLCFRLIKRAKKL